MACSCCAGESLDIFGEKAARRELRRYLRKGLGGSDAKLIVAWAEAAGLAGARVLEVGGGIGQVQAELLRRGAASGEVVEVVPDYEAPAAELAKAVGIADRSSFVLADLVEESEAIAAADVVVLRRVVCCSPNGPELLGRAAGKARITLLASYPRERRLTKIALGLGNLAVRVMRKRFRAFVHPIADLDRAVGQAGLRRSRTDRGVFWETAQFDVVP